MRSGAAAGHAGCFHETAFYGSDDELIDVVAPFVLDGVAAGEPTVVACAPHNTRLIERAAGRNGIRYLSGADLYARPGPTIRAYCDMFRSMLAEGATQIRVVGDVPHPGVGTDWHGWLRYEAAANQAYDDFPLWGLCPYDTRTTPDFVLDDVRRTHPHIADGSGGHRRNDEFVDPEALVAHHPSAHQRWAPDGEPAIVLEDPSPRTLRMAVSDLADGTLAPVEVEDLLVAASEAVTNAHHHGVSPVTARVWVEPRSVVVSVADRGQGPANPLAGLLPPATGRLGGRGLWIANQLCTEVRTTHGDDGFEITLRVTADPAVAA